METHLSQLKETVPSSLLHLIPQLTWLKTHRSEPNQLWDLLGLRQRSLEVQTLLTTESVLHKLAEAIQFWHQTWSVHNTLQLI
jgi:hypothetical protein